MEEYSRRLTVDQFYTFSFILGLIKLFHRFGFILYSMSLWKHVPNVTAIAEQMNDL